MRTHLNQSEGIKTLHLLDKNSPELLFLYDPESFFHTTYRNKFCDLCRKTSNDLILHENLIDYFDRLISPLRDTYRTIPENAVDLLKKPSFASAIWKAMLSVALSSRTQARLNAQRQLLISKGITHESTLPLPKWWTRIPTTVAEED